MLRITRIRFHDRMHLSRMLVRPGPGANFHSGKLAAVRFDEKKNSIMEA
jgi:hypothetical protein